MKVEYYHFGSQCPLSHVSIALLEEFSDFFELTTHDITDDPDTAKRMNMYFPSLLVVEGRRYYAPLTRSFLKRLADGEFPEEAPYIVNHGTQKKVGELVALSEDNMHVAGCCTGRKDLSKERFFQEQSSEVYGVLNLEDGKLIGGAEALPSQKVPYPIPKAKDYAFLTCVYPAEELIDAKAAPLSVLEQRLSQTYRKLYAVTAKEGTFPNGDLAWFQRLGYRDEGVVSVEENYATLHLVVKDL